MGHLGYIKCLELCDIKVSDTSNSGLWDMKYFKCHFENDILKLEGSVLVLQRVLYDTSGRSYYYRQCVAGYYIIVPNLLLSYALVYFEN